MNFFIAPSILSADFGQLAHEVEIVLNAGAEWIHVDVMDGLFVQNITMGPIVVEALRKRFSVPLDVHLMIQAPERYIDAFAKAGATYISVHAESTPHVHRAIEQIHQAGVSAGLALNPSTGLDTLTELVSDIDLLLLMTVNPGFGGQKYIATMNNKITRARALLDAYGRTDVEIEVDGGITANTIAAARQAGASVFVAGSSVFGAANRSEAIQQLRVAANMG